MASKMYVIKALDSNLNQILDCLKWRAKIYRNAEKFHAEGFCDAFDYEVARCDDADQARGIAKHCEDVIEDLESQMARQRFMEDEMNQNLDNSGRKQ